MRLSLKTFTSLSKLVVFVALSAFFLSRVFVAVAKLQKKEPQPHSFPYFEIVAVIELIFSSVVPSTCDLRK